MGMKSEKGPSNTLLITGMSYSCKLACPISNRIPVFRNCAMNMPLVMDFSY